MPVGEQNKEGRNQSKQMLSMLRDTCYFDDTPSVRRLSNAGQRKAVLWLHRYTAVRANLKRWAILQTLGNTTKRSGKSRCVNRESAARIRNSFEGALFSDYD